MRTYTVYTHKWTNPALLNAGTIRAMANPVKVKATDEIAALSMVRDTLPDYRTIAILPKSAKLPILFAR